MSRTFVLDRKADVSGVSGTGIVAEGVEFTDGTAVLRWFGDNPSTVVWPSVEAAMRIHGHDGKTHLVWDEDSSEEEQKKLPNRMRKRTPLADCPEIMTTSQLARVYGVDPKTARRWALEGRIPSQRTPGGHIRFDRDELAALGLARVS